MFNAIGLSEFRFVIILCPVVLKMYLTDTLDDGIPRYSLVNALILEHK